MGKLKTPFFVLAFVAILLVFCVEIGAPFLIGGQDATSRLRELNDSVGVAQMPPGATAQQPPGSGIPYLALIDVVALFTVALMGLGLIVPERIHGRIQGVITLVASIVLILVSLVLLVIAIVLLITMITLLFAFPFGTIAYLVIWGFFPRGDAAIVLSLLMFLKVVFAVMLVLAQPRFLQNKGLVALIITSLLANVVLSFLHGLVPVILVSITDQLGAIVFAVVAIIWGLILLIGSIPAIVKAARVTVTS
jgi:hypothetical protein